MLSVRTQTYGPAWSSWLLLLFPFSNLGLGPGRWQGSAADRPHLRCFLAAHQHRSCYLRSQATAQKISQLPPPDPVLARTGECSGDLPKLTIVLPCIDPRNSPSCSSTGHSALISATAARDFAMQHYTGCHRAPQPLAGPAPSWLHVPVCQPQLGCKGGESCQLEGPG